MRLAKYREKRQFQQTPEPMGKVAQRSGWAYVIQKHAASHLHYDFRLELDGVLKSWAVPKGPCLDPTVKRLAVEVEDHPVDYGGFEGVIPQGQYGGGTVLLWDTGTWEPIGDPHTGYRQGKLKFELHGSKLHGAWMLVRSRRPGASKPQWLLIKERDDEARPLSEGDVLDELPLSVVSERDLDEIATGKSRVWNSNQTSNGRVSQSTKKSTKKVAARKTKSPSPAIEGAKPEKLPTQLQPQLATLTKSAPSGDEWLHEVKFDGYRMLCRIDDGKVTFISRNQLDWTTRLSSLNSSLKELPVKSALLDGEVVVLQADGTSDFQALQNAFRDGEIQDLVYYVFDLLHLDGQNLRGLPLETRKAKLGEILQVAGSSSHVRYSEHIEGQGADFAKQACHLHLEGIICKRRDRPYQPGRGFDWLKVKCVKEEEFVIGGYTDPSGSRKGFGALLLGYYDKDKKLKYAGKVGTGFDQRTLESLLERLQPLARKTPAYSDPAQLTEVRRAHWVEPKLVAQIVYGSRTREGILRHSRFVGLREDKPAKEVTLDKAIPVTEAVKKSGKTVKSATRSTPKSAKSTALGYDAKNQTFHGVRLTSPDKVLYPESGITKLQLATYYHEIADWILPHLVHRPIVLVRCPDGQANECFYQKHPGVGTPDELRQIPIQEKTKADPYVLVDNVSGLIALAQVGALEIHAWGSREDQLEKPDRLIFDLDPDPQVTWPHVVESARQIREFLQEIGLESFVKTTGGKGLHLVVPIDRRHDWDEAKTFCKQVADSIVAAAPQAYTSNMAKAARTGKIFIDYLRNGRGATAIVPYSTRARTGAPVSTPLTWKELSPKIPSNHFTVENLPQRLSKLKADPWDGIGKLRQGLAGPIKRLRELSQGTERPSSRKRS